ncbi:MAG: nucleotidyltransferase domain-containing protein [Desulfobacterales bacterium]|nr:nucleotidyltransferase domain-containing protein [Desulfobacterales bacterium]
MSQTNLIETLKKNLPHLLSQHDAVLSAYVFGSVAAGVEHDGSDVDIAVRVDSNLSSEKTFELRLKLIDELESCSGRPVDVVLLNSASLKMIHQALKSGNLIYAANLKEEMAYGIQKRKEYFDFRYYLNDERNVMKAFFNA